MNGDLRWMQYVAALVAGAFIGASVWWRASGDPARGGLITVGAAFVVLLGVANWARRRRDASH